MRNAVGCFLLFAVLVSCKKSDSGEEVIIPNKLADVITGATTNISTTTVTVSGNLATVGNPASTEYGIVWSTSTGPTTASNKVIAGTSSTPTSYQVHLTGLNVDQIYFVRSYATNGAGTKYGYETSFKTTSRTTCDLSTLTGTLSNGVVLYLPFCGNVSDKSALANHGVATGNQYSLDRLGNWNAAFLFKGSSEKVSVADHPGLNTGTFTISLWFTTTNLTTPQKLLHKANWADGTNEVYTLIANQPNLKNVFARYKIGSGCQRMAGWEDIFATFPNSDWQHVVVTNDGIAGKLYLNGTLVGTNAMQSGLTDICPGGNITIGAGWANDPSWFKGAIDDVIIYNRAISATEVQALFQL